MDIFSEKLSLPLPASDVIVQEMKKKSQIHGRLLILLLVIFGSPLLADWGPPSLRPWLSEKVAHGALRSKKLAAKARRKQHPALKGALTDARHTQSKRHALAEGKKAIEPELKGQRWPSWQPPNPEDLDRIAESPTWLNLLHYYHSDPLGVFRSDFSDNSDFFLAPEGRQDARAELVATLQALFLDPGELPVVPNAQVGRLKQHPQCAFPARFHYLQSVLDIKPKRVACPDWERALRGGRPQQGVRLVWVGASMDALETAMGNFFLRFPLAKGSLGVTPAVGVKVTAKAEAKGEDTGERKDKLEPPLEIVWEASASQDDPSAIFGFLRAWSGQNGRWGWVGEKAQSLPNAAFWQPLQRDRWEYELNVTAEEALLWLQHLWELQNSGGWSLSFVPYNPAEAFFSSLQVAKPDWDLKGEVGYFTPAQMVERMLKLPGAVKQTRFFPALERQLKGSYEAWTSVQRQEARELLKAEKSPVLAGAKLSGLPGNASGSLKDQKLLLPWVSRYLRVLEEKKGGSLPERQKALATQLATLHVKPSELEEKAPITAVLQSEKGPQDAHHAGRVGLAGGVQAYPGLASPSYFQELNYRFAYHDLLNDDSGGFLPQSEFTLLSFSLRWTPDQAQVGRVPGPSLFWLERFQLFSWTQLRPWDSLTQDLSWQWQADYYSPRDFGCYTAHAARFYGGPGVTFNLLSPHKNLSLVTYVFTMLDLEYGSELMYRVAPKASWGFLAQLAEHYKVRTQLDLLWDLTARTQNNARQAFFFEASFDQSYALSQSFELRNRLALVVPTQRQLAGDGLVGEAQVLLNWYF